MTARQSIALSFGTLMIATLATGCAAFEGDVYVQGEGLYPPSSSQVLAPSPPIEGPILPVELGNTGPLAIDGVLEGELRGITLSGATLSNYGALDEYDPSWSYLQMNIATNGSPSGAGMLIANLSGSGLLRDELLDGHWTSTPLGDGSLPLSVGSCAGPVLGTWPDEIASTDYEMDSMEDPEQPGVVVAVVKARFPRGGADLETTELTGTFRFELPAPIER